LPVLLGRGLLTARDGDLLLGFQPCLLRLALSRGSPIAQLSGLHALLFELPRALTARCQCDDGDYDYDCDDDQDDCGSTHGGLPVCCPGCSTRLSRLRGPQMKRFT